MMAFLLWIEQLPFCVWVRESSSLWALPMFLFMHTLGMSMIAGGSVIIDLAFLGFWPKVSVKPLVRLYPLMWGGFWINAVTGSVLTVADASTKLTNPVFYIKMIFVFSGVAVLIKMRRGIFDSEIADAALISGSGKRLAWASLICWFGAITAGRLLAYLGPVSGLNGVSNH